jgi:hypothetical protein
MIPHAAKAAPEQARDFPSAAQGPGGEGNGAAMFDPYRKWLGVPEGQRPPTHYQLLGISPDERDPEVIDAAVLRQSAFVRNFQTGKYTAEATRLLTEIAAAKLCLIDPEKRARYDAELRAKEPEAGAAAAPQHAAPQSQSPPPQSPPPQKTSPPKTSPRTPAPQSPVSRPAVQVAAPIAPAARPAAAPRRSASAPRMHAAGALQPWAVEPPRLGNFAYAPRAASDKRPLWIGLAVFACLAPLALMVVVLLSRPDDPSVAAADSQPDALPVVPAPAGVDPLAAPPAADRNFPPPVSPLVETTSPVSAFPPVVETSPPANGLLPGAPQFAPPSGPPGMEGARPEPSAPGGSSLEVPDDSQEFIDRIQREARERQREMEREAEQRQREFEIRRRIPGSFLNPFAKKTDEGLDTMFVGHNGGSSQRTIKPGSFLVGISYRLGEWGRERCVAEIKPIFSRDATP